MKYNRNTTLHFPTINYVFIYILFNFNYVISGYYFILWYVTRKNNLLKVLTSVHIFSPNNIHDANLKATNPKAR